MTQPTLHDLNIEEMPYFETEDSNNLLCGMHAINNLLGEETFKEDDLQKIYEELNSADNNEKNKVEKHCCFNGDYSSAVLFAALAKLELEVEELDKNNKITVKKLEDVEAGKDNKECIGFLVNAKKNLSCFKAFIGKLLCYSDRHWCCIRRYNKNYVLLDSLFDQPLYFQTLEQVLNFVHLQLDKDGEVILVRRTIKKQFKLIL